MDVVSGDARDAPGGEAAPRHPAEDHDRPRREPRCESSFGRDSCGSCSSESGGGRVYELRAFPDGDDRRHDLARRTDDHLRPTRRRPAALVTRWERLGERLLYAHNAIEIVATAVAEDEMAGISGDHPAKRAYAARVLRAAASMVRDLAADAAGDGALTVERWAEALSILFDAAALFDPSWMNLRPGDAPHGGYHQAYCACWCGETHDLFEADDLNDEVEARAAFAERARQLTKLDKDGRPYLELDDVMRLFGFNPDTT